LKLVNRDDNLHTGSGDNGWVPSRKAIGHLRQRLAACLNNMPQLGKAGRGPCKNLHLIADRKNLIGNIFV
jgi:hypothetical protein